MSEEVKRYEAVGKMVKKDGKYRDEIFYLDMFAPLGERGRTIIEPIADEI